jgi:hypothetical protein
VQEVPNASAAPPSNPPTRTYGGGGWVVGGSVVGGSVVGGSVVGGSVVGGSVVGGSVVGGSVVGGSVVGGSVVGGSVVDGWVVPVVPVPAIPLSFSAEIACPAPTTARIIDPETGEEVVIPLPPGTTVIDGGVVPVENTGTTGPGSTAKYRSASLAEV